MDAMNDVLQFKINESERTPNLYAARALLGVLCTIFLACVLNEIGVFEVEKAIVWECFLLAVAFCAIAYFVSHNNKLSAAPATKYVLLVMVLVLTLVVTVFLNISAVLLLILPMLLATRYRSMRVSALAVAGSALCCVLYPLLAWKANSWSLNILLGYVETVCKVSITGLGPSAQSLGETVFNMLVYLSLPQLMVILVFGSIILSITRNSVRGMEDRAEVMKLDADLKEELRHVMTMQDQVLYAMADMVESRDPGTGSHIKRTREVVRILLECMKSDPSMGLTDEFCEAVVKAAPLHDLGKIAVDDGILRKPGRLTPQERKIIQQHPVKSAEIIRKVLSGMESERFIEIAENLAMYHHEWYDGSGYPKGLVGKAIPLEARVMAIADVYDALVSKRSYKEPVSPDEADREIRKAMGTQFDPALEPFFERVRGEIEGFYRSESEEGMIGSQKKF